MENTETAGGTRFNAGKPGGWWYAPILGLRLVAPVWMQGAEKYAPKDWRVGQSFSVLIDCAFRHMLEVVDKGPKSRCPESGNLHAAHAVWNLLCMLTLMVLGRDDCDDVTKWEGVTTAMKGEMEELEELVDGVTVDDVSEAAKVLEGGGIPGRAFMESLRCTCIFYGGDYDKRRALNLSCPEHGKGDPEPTPREMARVPERCRVCGQTAKHCTMMRKL